MQRRKTPRPKALWVQIRGEKKSVTKRFIRPVSKRRAKENRLYAKLREIHLLEIPVCEVCRSRSASEIHHKRGRVGPLLNDRTHWLSVCRICHNLIHMAPKWAREQGYIESWHKTSK